MTELLGQISDFITGSIIYVAQPISLRATELTSILATLAQTLPSDPQTTPSTLPTPPVPALHWILCFWAIPAAACLWIQWRLGWFFPRAAHSPHLSAPGRRRLFSAAWIMIVWIFGQVLVGISLALTHNEGKLLIMGLLAVTLVMSFLAGISYLSHEKKEQLQHDLARPLSIAKRHWMRECFEGVLALAVWLPVVMASNVLFLMLMQAIGQSTEQGHAMLKQLQNASWSMILLIWFMAGLAVPVFEELLFRGLLQRGLTSVFSAQPAIANRPSSYQTLAVWASILSSSLIFAALHGIMSAPPIFVLSIGIALLYHRTGSLLGPFVMHGLFNSLSLALVLLARFATPN